MTEETTVQSEAAPEPVIDGGGEAEDNAQGPDAQPAGQAGSEQEKIGGEDLPPELKEKQKELLRDYHKKTQALAEDRRKFGEESARYKQDAETLYELSQQPWFKSAVEGERGRRNGASAEISEEQFEVLKNDRRAFQEFLSKRDKSIVEGIKGEFKQEFAKLSKNQQELVTEKEFEHTKGLYGDDFADASSSGDLDKYLGKGLNYEDAFKLYMADKGELPMKVSQKTTQTASVKRGGSIEKTGLTAPRGGPVVKATGLNEALERAFDMARKGTKDYKLERA